VNSNQRGGIGVAFGRSIQTGLGATAAAALAFTAPLTSFENMFNAGPTFHVLSAGAALRADADPASKTKGVLRKGSCVQWIESAQGSARILIHTAAKMKEVWMDASLLKAAPPETRVETCKAEFLRPNNTLDARVK